MNTHTVIALSPGEIEDTGISGNLETCTTCAEILTVLEADRQVFYAVVSLERDLPDLRDHIARAA